MQKKGFTLIELLIVVAIIAILALIAVPNFLEAQTRSKISRAKADMRSMATGLESYFTDHNAYPTYHYVTYSACKAPVTNEFFIGGTAFYGGSPEPFDGNPQITTPIAYLTSLPKDPFYVRVYDSPPEATCFEYTNFTYAFRTSPMPAVIKMYGVWRTTCGGPDKSRAHINGDNFNIIYDPSNGTVSLGQVHRTQLSPDGIPMQ